MISAAIFKCEEVTGSKLPPNNATLNFEDLHGYKDTSKRVSIIGSSIVKTVVSTVSTVSTVRTVSTVNTVSTVSTVSTVPLSSCHGDGVIFGAHRQSTGLFNTKTWRASDSS